MPRAPKGVPGRRSSRTLAAAVIVAAVASTAAAARPPRHRAACPPAGARLIAGDRIVRVYSTMPAAPRFAPPTSTACLVRRGTRMTLVTPVSPAAPGLRKFLGRVALSGAIVAYLEGQFGVDSGCESIRIADVATRRVLQEVPDIACSVDAGIIRREVVTDLVVGTGGAVGWILERGTDATPNTVVVYTVTAGAATVLDEGPNIGPRSLTLSSHTLGWRHAGLDRTAAVTP